MCEMNTGLDIQYEEYRAKETDIRGHQPLIHCITNPISIHDCANIVLAAGARPIMAEHPAESAEITAASQALALNLGNITDARMKSIANSGETAFARNIPVILDLVGIGCSRLRRDFALDFLRRRKIGSPFILKGNMSEILALQEENPTVSGVDVSEQDLRLAEAESEAAQRLQALAAEFQAVIFASGKTDIVSDDRNTYFVYSGSPMMSKITGTGCMLTVLTASYMSEMRPVTAAVMAAATFGVSGEIAEEMCCGESDVIPRRIGTGSYQVALLDAVSTITPEQVTERCRLRMTGTQTGPS